MISQVLLEQLISSPCTHFLFLVYYGLIVEGKHQQFIQCLSSFDIKMLALVSRV